MNILEYLFYNNINKSDFAKKLHISRCHFSNCLVGVKIMGWKTCLKVEKVTKGVITADAIREYSEEQMRKKNGRARKT